MAPALIPIYSNWNKEVPKQPWQWMFPRAENTSPHDTALTLITTPKPSLSVGGPPRGKGRREFSTVVRAAAAV